QEVSIRLIEPFLDNKWSPERIELGGIPCQKNRPTKPDRSSTNVAPFRSNSCRKNWRASRKNDSRCPGANRRADRRRPFPGGASYARRTTTDSAETLPRLPPLGGQRLGPGSEQDDVHGTGDVPDSHLGVFHAVVRRGSMNPHRLPTGAKALSDSADGFAKERMV